LKNEHEKELNLAISTLGSSCDLCAEVMTGDRMCRVAHVENHLIEIALSVVPTDEGYDPGEVEDIGAALELRPLTANNLEKLTGPTNVLGKHDDTESLNSSTQAVWTATRKSKRRLPQKVGSNSRTFPCLLQHYGCGASYASKNEWKRHLNTQHFKSGFRRCDLCPPTIDLADVGRVYYNDFNRKDLFTQHLRRMHAAPRDMSNTSKDYPVKEDNIPQHQTRCFQQLRILPNVVSCVFCTRVYLKSDAWAEGVEHIGRHLEKDPEEKIAATWRDWKQVPVREKYLVEEGLIVRNDGGDWAIGNGKPLRRNLDDDSEN
jgi:hypothetical protein